MAYLTRVDIENRMGALTDAQWTYVEETLLPSIQSYIEQMTYTQFDNETSSDVYVDGNGSSSLIIPTMSTVTAVNAVNDEGTLNLIPANSYTVFPRTGSIFALRNRGGTWDEGLENYRVTGKLGYEDVPAAIKAVALELAVGNLNQNISNFKAEKVGDYSVTYGDQGASGSLSAMSMAVFDNYNRISRSV